MLSGGSDEALRQLKVAILRASSPGRFFQQRGFTELGYPILTGITWFAICGPAGMPPAIVEKINAEVRRGLQTPAARRQLATESMVTADDDAATFTRYVAAEIERWTPMVRSNTKPKN